MPADREPILMSDKPDNFTMLLVDGLSGIPYKQMMFLFVIYLILSSDVFINRVLAQFKGAVDFKQPSNYGIMIQGILLIIMFGIVDICAKQKII